MNKILLASPSKLMSSSIVCNLFCFYFIAGEILINISTRQNPMYFIKFRDKFNFLTLVLKVIFSSCQKSLFLEFKTEICMWHYRIEAIFPVSTHPCAAYGLIYKLKESIPKFRDFWLFGIVLLLFFHSTIDTPVSIQCGY